MTVRVVVVHDDTRLSGALVRLLTPAGPTVSATTNPAGTVQLRVAIPGSYRFALSAVGFHPDTLRLELGAQAADTVLTSLLEPVAAELAELVVSTRSERRIEEQAVRVEALAREEIEEKLLMTPGDISMLLNETGGLRVQTTSPSLGGALVRVQGLRGRYTQLLADGLPLYGGQAGSLGLLQIPPMDLGRVEIIKGASSALYGGTAPGGVINLISRRPPAAGVPGERELLLNLTSLGGTDAVGWAAGHLGRAWGYSLLGSGHRQGRSDRDGDGWTDVPGFRRLLVRPRLFHEDAAGRSLFLTLGATLEQREGGTLDGAVAPDGAPFAESLRTARGDLGVLARIPLGGALLVVRASGMAQSHRHRFGEDREPDRHRTMFAEAALSRVAGPVLLVVGGALQAEHYRNEAFPAFDHDFTVPGLFLHAELAGTRALSAALSTRFDHHSRYGSFWSPLLSLRAAPASGLSLRAAAGTGFFGPTPFIEATEVTGLSRLAPLGALEAERIRTASFDVQGIIGSLELNGTLFHSVVTHAVQLRESASGAMLVNAAEPTRTSGVDLVWRYRREPIGVTASYTFTRATEPHPESGVRRRVPLTPRHAAGIVAVYEREGRTRVGAELYYTGRQALDDDPYRSSSKPYVIVGLLAEQRMGRARLFLNLENLGGVRQTRYAPLVRPARAPDGRWTTDAWAPLEGRVINGGVRLQR